MKRIVIILLYLAAACISLQAQPIQPSGDYLFAQKDGVELFLSVYDPAEGSATTLDGKAKPCILFVFGGGFIMGERNADGYLPWFKRLTDDGYRVITIDYRLGLKGKGSIGVKDVAVIYNAVETGVEDLYSATAFIAGNAEALGVDPSNIVIAGSSAGAMIVLQAEWHLCNKTALTSILPENFRYAGVMSFSGAIFSREGKIRYAREPAPALLFHGTADKIVTYKQLWFFRNRMAGSSTLAGIFNKNGYNYNIFRYEGNQHEIASAFLPTYDKQISFLEANVIRGEKKIVDATVNDPSIKIWKINSVKQIYKGN